MKIIHLAMLSTILVGCGSDQKPQIHKISGTVSGLNSSMTLALNNQELVIQNNGSFSFSTTIEQGQAYSVTITQQPLGQTCEIDNATGTASSGVKDIVVSCENIIYKLTGEVSGLDGSIVITDGEQHLTLTEPGRFAFAKGYEFGQTYEVTLVTTDELFNCEILKGQGTFQQSDISDISILCNKKMFKEAREIYSTQNDFQLIHTNYGLVTKADNGVKLLEYKDKRLSSEPSNYINTYLADLDNVPELHDFNGDGFYDQFQWRTDLDGQVERFFTDIKFGDELGFGNIKEINTGVSNDVNDVAPFMLSNEFSDIDNNNRAEIRLGIEAGASIGWYLMELDEDMQWKFMPYHWDSSFADINNDGLLDVIENIEDTYCFCIMNEVRYKLATADAGYLDPVNIGVVHDERFTVNVIQDIDKNGNVDLIDTKNDIAFLQNNGEFTRLNLSSGRIPRHFGKVIANVDGSFFDIVEGMLVIYDYNAEVKEFVMTAQHELISTNSKYLFIDLDTDGDIDILSYGDNSISVIENLAI